MIQCKILISECKNKFDQVLDRSKWAVTFLAQSHTEGHCDEDHTDHLTIVTQRSKQALGHILNKRHERIGRMRGFHGGLCWREPRTSPWLDHVGDGQSNGDRHQRVHQQQSWQACRKRAAEMRRHERVHNRGKDQRWRERTEKAKHQFAGCRQEGGLASQRKACRDAQYHADDDASIQWDLLPSWRSGWREAPGESFLLRHAHPQGITPIVPSRPCKAQDLPTVPYSDRVRYEVVNGAVVDSVPTK
jgi:hypothetical protein